MFKTILDILGIPLTEVTPEDLMPIVSSMQYRQDIQSSVAEGGIPKYIVISDSRSQSILYYYLIPGRFSISVHTYTVNMAGLLKLYNEKYKKENKLETYITRRKHVKG